MPYKADQVFIFSRNQSHPDADTGRPFYLDIDDERDVTPTAEELVALDTTAPGEASGLGGSSARRRDRCTMLGRPW